MCAYVLGFQDCSIAPMYIYLHNFLFLLWLGTLYCFTGSCILRNIRALLCSYNYIQFGCVIFRIYLSCTCLLFVQYSQRNVLRSIRSLQKSENLKQNLNTHKCHFSFKYIVSNFLSTVSHHSTRCLMPFWQKLRVFVRRL